MNAGAPDWRVGQLMVQATAAAIGIAITVVTDDVSLSYRTTYFPVGPPSATALVAYVDRVHYVPLHLVQQQSPNPVSQPAPIAKRTPQVPWRERLQAARLQLRSVGSSSRRTMSGNQSNAPSDTLGIHAGDHGTNAAPSTHEHHVTSHADTLPADTVRMQRIQLLQQVANRHLSAIGTSRTPVSRRRQRSPQRAVSEDTGLAESVISESELPAKRRHFDNG